MNRTLIRNARLDGRIVDIALAGGRIADIGPGLRGEELFDARGRPVLPGLHDHHIHLLATAAQRDSILLERCADGDAVARALRVAPPGRGWLRATGYHERIAGPLDARALDALIPDRPLRVQHQTGALWMLNGPALAALGTTDWPEGAERDALGAPTGRFFRCDPWLSDRIGRTPPDLAALGRALAAQGVTGVTDASVSTDASAATLIVGTRLPLRLTLMSGGPLPPSPDYTTGPVKILLDDDRLPALDAIVAAITDARRQGRAVAAHCVTAGELAMMLAAFEEAGARPGDRIEHGSIIPADAIPVLRALGLTVVTQPGFVATRGERYRALVDPAEQPDLYRAASLVAAGVPLGGSSDAPYGDPDPWAGIRAAVVRRTQGGNPLGLAEALSPPRALALYLAPADAPGGPVRRIVPGAPADLCVLQAPIGRILAEPHLAPVAATIQGGVPVHVAS
ncbi:MAG: amidohydrolase family protein [Sphingobium sp.]